MRYFTLTLKFASYTLATIVAVNNCFGNLVKAERLSYVKLDKTTEAELQSCFSCDIDFHYPNKEVLSNKE